MATESQSTSDNSGSTLWGSLLYYGDRFVGTQDTKGFLTDTKRDEYEAGLSESAKAEVTANQQKILLGLIAEFEKKDPGGLSVRALKEYQARNEVPDVIKDLSLEAAHAANQLGIMDYAGIFIESVIATFTGESGEVYDQNNLGFFGRIQANIAERGSKEFADTMYKNMMANAKDSGGTEEQQRIAKLVSEHKLRGLAFGEAADRVGLTVESSQLVGIYRPKDTDGPAV